MSVWSWILRALGWAARHPKEIETVIEEVEEVVDPDALEVHGPISRREEANIRRQIESARGPRPPTPPAKPKE